MPVNDSTRTATAYPLTPPNGANIPANASFASVVGAPSFVKAQPGSNRVNPEKLNNDDQITITDQVFAQLGF